jgi:ribosomal subunit interface protein
MQIRVHSRDGRVPRNLETFATQKLEHLGKFLPTIEKIEIELYEEGRPKSPNGHVAHVTVATTGPSFRSKVTSGDFRTCIDIAADRLYRRITEFKRKRSSKPAHSRSSRKPQKEVIAGDPSLLGLPEEDSPTL